MKKLISKQYTIKNRAKFHIFCLMLPFLSLFIIGCPGKIIDPVQKIYNYNDSALVDNYMRTWQTDLPQNYYDTIKIPLVIFLHGTGGSASQCKNDYKFSEKAITQGFIVMYPEGVRSDGILGIRTWNAGICCDYAADHHIDDVHFVNTLIELGISRYKVDPKRVYITGMSNGAMMTYRLACELSEKIAAIASVSGTMMTENQCTAQKAIPILHIHSALDTKIPSAGGIGIGGYYFPPVDSVLNVWSSIDHCGTVSTIEYNEYTFKKWKGYADDTEIFYYLTKDGGHAWPGGLKSRAAADPPSTVINANDLILEFFNKHSLQ